MRIGFRNVDSQEMDGLAPLRGSARERPDVEAALLEDRVSLTFELTRDGHIQVGKVTSQRNQFSFESTDFVLPEERRPTTNIGSIPGCSTPGAVEADERGAHERGRALRVGEERFPARARGGASDRARHGHGHDEPPIPPCPGPVRRHSSQDRAGRPSRRRDPGRRPGTVRSRSGCSSPTRRAQPARTSAPTIAFALASGLNFFFRAAMEDEAHDRVGLEVSRQFYEFAHDAQVEPWMPELDREAAPLLASLMSGELERLRFESVDHARSSTRRSTSARRLRPTRRASCGRRRFSAGLRPTAR